MPLLYCREVEIASERQVGYGHTELSPGLYKFRAIVLEIVLCLEPFFYWMRQSSELPYEVVQ
jgi:hypothetical protein